MQTIDLGCNRQAGAKYAVRRIPTFIFVSGGEEIRRVSGHQSKEQLRWLFRDPKSIF